MRFGCVPGRHARAELHRGVAAWGRQNSAVTVAMSGSLVEVVIYLLCVATSLLCAYLLARGYRRRRIRLLVWSAVCFGLLAINNLVLAVDVLLLPEIDLGFFRAFTSLLATGVLLVGFIWDT